MRILQIAFLSALLLISQSSTLSAQGKSLEDVPAESVTIISQSLPANNAKTCEEQTKAVAYNSNLNVVIGTCFNEKFEIVSKTFCELAYSDTLKRRLQKDENGVNMRSCNTKLLKTD